MKPLGVRVIEGVRDLLFPVRLNAGWATEVGALIRLAPPHGSIDEDLYWLTLVYTAAEEISGPNGGPVLALSRRVHVGHIVHVDVFTKRELGNEEVQWQTLKCDVRKALSPLTGVLSDAAGNIGQVQHLGAVALYDIQHVIGCRTRMQVNYFETWGNPAQVA